MPSPTTVTPGQILILDLSAVTFIDSSGLGLIVKLFRARTQSGGGLVLLRPTATVRTLLTTVRLDRVIPSIEDPNDAQAAMGLRRHQPNNANDPGDQLTLHLTGNLTSSTVTATRHWIEESWVSRPSAQRLRLNLQAVNFADSSGLGLFVQIHRLVQARPGASLVLTAMNENVRNVVQLAKLDRLFQIDASNHATR